jgi:hypothetical protein
VVVTCAVLLTEQYANVYDCFKSKGVWLVPKAVFVTVVLVVMGVTGWFVSLATEAADLEAAARNQEAQSDYWLRPVATTTSKLQGMRRETERGPKPIEIPSRARLVRKVGAGVIVLEGAAAVALYFVLYGRRSSASES